ncbi:MAG: diaminopimelate decarboxylase, partial [Armatimonadota bacterium]|nr:diaminopimelate decarboxylase [Armatimonadota bacterium]
KEIDGVRTYVAVDGGMYENPRPALYGARYEAVVAERPDDPAERVVALAGRCCESGDVLVWEAHLPAVRPGDVVAVFSTGAYTYSMASNYNRFPRPALVLAEGGQAALVVRREGYEDLVRLDVPLSAEVYQAVARGPAAGGCEGV